MSRIGGKENDIGGIRGVANDVAHRKKFPQVKIKRKSRRQFDEGREVRPKLSCANAASAVAFLGGSVEMSVMAGYKLKIF